MLRNLKTILQKLVVHPENMKRNLELTGGLINAEAIMMRLAPKIGRLRAHHIVYEASEKVLKENKSFKEALLENETLRRFISERELEKLLDPAEYTGLSSRVD